MQHWLVLLLLPYGPRGCSEAQTQSYVKVLSLLFVSVQHRQKARGCILVLLPRLGLYFECSLIMLEIEPVPHMLGTCSPPELYPQP
jgi:hypothetical protein